MRISRLVGIALILLGGGGAIYAAIVLTSQCLYFSAKYGDAQNDLYRSLRLIRTAHRLYPHNFYASIYASEQSYHRAQQTEDSEDAAWLMRRANDWCGVGLKQNEYDRSLRLRWTALLAERDRPAAIAYMEQYVDWHFWDPWHHAVLAELYARAGRTDKARRELIWVKQNAEYYPRAAQMVDDATQAFLDELTGAR